MRHFIAYHSTRKMGYSSTSLVTPHAKTSKPVVGLENVTVWLVAGEGGRPTSYFLAAKFIAKECEPEKHPGTKLPNEISGAGSLFKLTKPLDGTALLERIRANSRNFQNGFHETTDVDVIHGLLAL